MTRLSSDEVTSVSCRKHGKGIAHTLTPQQRLARRVADTCWLLASQALAIGNRNDAASYLDVAKILWHNTCIHTERSEA